MFRHDRSYRVEMISIHAPAGGATVKRGADIAKPEIFQFTPLREGRLKDGKAYTDGKLFQFTPLREGRQKSPRMTERATHFNSRPCGRGDRRRARRGSCLHISIHAPAGGATLRIFVKDDSPNIFQFTPLREGRQFGNNS